MDEITFVMLSIILLVLGILAWLIWTNKSQKQNASIDPLIVQQAVQQGMLTTTPMLKDAMTSSIAQGSDLFKGAFTASLQDLRFQEEIGAVKAAATEIQSTSAVLRTIFEQKSARASFSEFQLEEILKDAFPETKFGIRENLGDLGTPDANIRTTEGIICIDAKFPLENYRRVIEAKTDSERKRIAADFRRDVEKHVDKVAGYVRPDRNTAAVAYAFIPSEAVFHYIADAEPEILRQAAIHNVVVTSPSTLLASLSLIRIAMRSQEINERAAQIESDLRGLEQQFESFQKNWGTLKGHIQKAHAKSDDVDSSYTRLKDKFENVTRLKLEDSDADSSEEAPSPPQQ